VPFSRCETLFTRELPSLNLGLDDGLERLGLSVSRGIPPP
jgi:hypothetical protein